MYEDFPYVVLEFFKSQNLTVFMVSADPCNVEMTWGM